MSVRQCDPKRRDRRFGHTGFTLLELLVTIGIMGLVAGIGFAAADRAMTAQVFLTASSQVERSVRAAQADAIRENRTVVVPPFARIDPRAAVATAGNAYANQIRIEQAPVAIRFFGDGTSSGDTVRVMSGQRRFQIAIDPVTGVIASGPV